MRSLPARLPAFDSLDTASIEDVRACASCEQAEGASAKQRVKAIHGYSDVAFSVSETAIAPLSKKHKKNSSFVGQRMSHPPVYIRCMKTDSYINDLLIPINPCITRSRARRGIALLRAWRLRFMRCEHRGPVQTEFNFGSAALVPHRRHQNTRNAAAQLFL